ncbi:hypothetical protein AAVH_25135 [Aphelenchoides avenae]|nr:hypothetical protein AAVH_25135 [Aphelenchus avenae]
MPNETMLEVLLWLDRFDLDVKQITARSLRSLVENNQCIQPDAEKAPLYLSSCYVCDFNVYWHRRALPRQSVIAAPALIRQLDFRYCNFDNDKKDSLGETLDGSNFRCLTLFSSSIPGWQIDDTRLELLRLHGCNEIHLWPDITEPFKLTEEGILSYCFTLDDGLHVPESCFLRLTWTKASKTSQLTCNVELCLEHPQFDVANLDANVGVLPSRSREYDRMADANLTNLHFKSADSKEWEVVVRHGRKDHDEFFVPAPDNAMEYSPNAEYWEHKPEVENAGDWYE